MSAFAAAKFQYRRAQKSCACRHRVSFKYTSLTQPRADMRSGTKKRLTKKFGVKLNSSELKTKLILRCVHVQEQRLRRLVEVRPELR